MDSVKYIFEKLYLSGKVLRWQFLLSEYDFMYITWIVVRDNAIIDHLAKNAIDDYEASMFNFLDKDVMALSKDDKTEESDSKWKMYFDKVVKESGN